MRATALLLVALPSTPYADATSPMRGDDFPLLRPAVDTTHQNCTCKGKCGASITDDYASCDWCYTTDKCGSWSAITGYFDYCKYPPMQDYESQTHIEKMTQLWAKITDPSVVDQSGPVHWAAATLKILVSESMITAFSDHWDVLPAGREKVIHAQGVMCQFDLAVSSKSPFTGVLSPGKQSGMIRLGSATSLDEPLNPQIFPGFGIKFLRSGVRSANWVGLRTTGAPPVGQSGNYNFFETGFSNHVAPDDKLIKLGKFQQASGCIDMVGLSDACTYTQAGEKVGKPVFPFEVVFEPAGDASFPDKKKSNDDLLKELAGIPVGTEIFKVYAFASPADKKQGNKITLGTLTTTGTCHQSLFGDLELFFRHQRMEEDFASAPEWIPEMEAFSDPACKATVGPISKWQCPHLSGEAVVV